MSSLSVDGGLLDCDCSDLLNGSSIPMSSIDTTVTGIDADDSFTSATGCTSCPPSPTSACSPTKHALPTKSGSDLVIHYACASLPVHTVTLVHHSTYFAAHLRFLPPTSPCKQCHPTTRCLVQPALSTMHSKLRITAAQFQHFLCQLHYPTHYYCPPLSPPTNLDLTTHSPNPLPTTYPPAALLSRAIEWDGFQLSDSLDVEAFLTLAHHFRCDALLARCDDILLHFYSQLPAPVDLWMAWDRLVPAHCFELTKLRRHCLQLLSRDTRMDDEYEDNRQALKRQAGQQLYQQLMDEIGEMILSRVHSRICRQRTSLVASEAVRTLSELV